MFSQSAIDRFWSKIDTSGECWEWRAHTSPKGYGTMSIGRTRIKAHRFSWMLANGPIDPGVCVLHACDNPRCVRVSHLFLGSILDNNLDAIRKGRLVPNVQPRYGVDNGTAKLNDEKVREIRRIYDPVSGLSAPVIGRMFGVSKTTIRLAVKRQTWAHVD